MPCYFIFFITSILTNLRASTLFSFVTYELTRLRAFHLSFTLSRLRTSALNMIYNNLNHFQEDIKCTTNR